MKKIILLSITSLSFIHAKAQVPNPGFELLVNGIAANWRTNNFAVIPIDSNCIFMGFDSIQTSTRDAHSGNYAYEVRVATTCTDAYSGSIQTNRVDSEGFIDQRIPIHGQPSAFTFYYKLSSIQGDVGIAEAFMDNQSGNGTGDGSIQLPAASTWTLATLPMHYSASDTGGYLRLKFYLGNANGLHYGTRFVIDDIGQAAPTGINNTLEAFEGIDCFPSPAQNSVSIHLSGAAPGTNTVLNITDMTGRIVMQTPLQVPRDKTFTVDTRLLAPGLYNVRLSRSNRTTMGRFLK